MSKSKRFISLAEHNPELVSEWHPTKNIGITPEEISYGSARKVWWKCHNEHEWESAPNQRTRGRGCPKCAEINRKNTLRRNLVAKRGSLADINPTLASQWHPTKNVPLTPYDVTINSPERVWWQCEKDERHEWEAPINSRNGGAGCPICSGYKIIVGINDFATLRPDLAAQWHPTENGDLKPTDFTCGCDQDILWICEKGHAWQAKINNRCRGNNCPVCSNKKVIVGYNDLATVMPNLVKEWHPTKNIDLTPRNITYGSNKKIWWQCEKKHEWQASVSHRTNGRRCPKCFGESSTSFPEQAIFFYLRQLTTAYNRYLIAPKTEIDVYLPEYKIGIEYDGAYFHKGEASEQREKRKQEKLDKLGILLIRVREIEVQTSEHTIYSKPGANDIELAQTIKNLLDIIYGVTQISFDADIDITRDRIKIYEQYIQSEKDNSLAIVNPQVAAEWHPTKNASLLPEYVSVHSNKKVWWQCEKNHEWQAVINSRKNGVGCPYCTGKLAIVGSTDLATVNPKIASQWHPTQNGTLTPQDVTASSNKKVWWQCEKKHEWQTQVSHRTNGGNCPICSGREVLVGYNDLATINPKLASEWHPTKNADLKASDVTCGSDKKVWWQCDKRHEWQAVISSRKFGYGCPFCAGQKIIVGENDLETVNPELAAEWHPTKNGKLLPSDVMVGSHEKVWWLGKCGHEWEAIIYSRNAGRGCPYCSSQKLLVGFNDLATVNPKLASEWHPTKNGETTPRDIMPGSNKKFWWMCEKKHEWENTVNVRNGGNGCPYCANQIVLKGYNDLATLNPKLAAEWHPTKNGERKPSDFMPGSNKKAWWICENNHEWEAVINSRNAGAGCMACYRLRRKSQSK